MPAVCAIPNCKSGSRSSTRKYSLFKVPKDYALRKKWEKAIPGCISLRDQQVICIKYFSNDCIINKLVINDCFGDPIIDVLHKKPYLRENAVPSIFTEYLVRNTNQVFLREHNYSNPCFEPYISVPDIPNINAANSVTSESTTSMNDVMEVECIRFSSDSINNENNSMSYKSMYKAPDFFADYIDRSSDTKVIEEYVFDNLHEDFSKSVVEDQDSNITEVEYLVNIMSKDAVKSVVNDSTNRYVNDAMEIKGYLCRQILKKYKNCSVCCTALKSKNTTNPLAKLVKSEGRLIYNNSHFYKLISFVESCFRKHVTSVDVFELTMEEVCSTYDFSFPCVKHASDILSYALHYYIRMRMRQYTYQENQKINKSLYAKRKRLNYITNNTILYSYCNV